jgi:hypothetical protein
MCCLKINGTLVNKLTLLLLLALLITSCDRKEREANLYPIDSLVTAQIMSLTAMQAVLQKQAIMGAKADSIVFTPKDTADWVSELDIFRQLGVMNKPVSRASYLVDDGLYDPGSNLTVKVFTSTAPELPVQDLRVFYNRSVHYPRKIEARYDEETSLYKSSRLLTLEFQNINNKNILTSYSVKGGQKMIMGDSVIFSVKGKILID